MLETLSGRLKWEPTHGGIRVEIPARLSWGPIRTLLEDLGVAVLGFLSILIVAGIVAYLGGHSVRSYLHADGVRSLLISSLGCFTGLILVRTASILFGKTVVTLGPTEAIFQYRSPLRRWQEAFPTAALHSFRFVEWHGEIPVQNRFRQNEVQFGQTYGTCYFGAGVTREEAEALIAKMAAVYPFPSYLPTAPALEAQAV